MSRLELIKIVILILCSSLIGWLALVNEPSQTNSILIFFLVIIKIFIYLDQINLLE